MGKTYTLWYNSFDLQEDLDDVATLNSNRDEHMEDSLALSIEDLGRAHLELCFHGRPEESAFTAGLEDLLNRDPDALEAWCERSWEFPNENVTLTRFKEELAKVFPEQDVARWLAYRQ
jgi:hypothetical protein